MKVITKYYLLLFTSAALYYICSKTVFDKVYDTTHIVIDELFHLPQGLEYCKRNFTYWDPKITTLPGLYLISAAFLGSYVPCTIYNLRFVNLIASCINLLLFSSILKFIYGNNDSQLKIVLQAVSLTVLPPLYFFSHVYYTDTMSLMFLLAFFRLCFMNQYKFFILLLGFASVMMRQTNIVWVAMVFIHKALDLFIKSSRVFGNETLTKVKLSKQSLISTDIDASKLKRYYQLSDVYVALKYHFGTYFINFKNFLTYHDWSVLFTHSIILLSFVYFVYVNGSIVLGDKKAHEATLHIPQMLYFLIFFGVFGLPYVLSNIISTIKLIFRNKIKMLLLIILFMIVVHFNTIIHPYLLADNRHYTFYVWNRWFLKYDYAVYATVPVYTFLLFSLYDNLKDQNCISFLLPFSLSLFLVLSLQKMIEIRYFLIPYIILRLRFARPSYKLVVLEFIWYLLLNSLTFYIFFTKEIYWKDFNYAQRLIW